MNDPYSSAVLDDCPVGYWRLNERSHTEKVFDETGHGHDGVFVGEPQLGVPGAIRGIPDCSMSFLPGEYIQVPHSPAFSIQTSGHGLSVEVWMRPGALTFPVEEGKDYVHWLGKGELHREPRPDAMEWGFRFYSKTHPTRPNRICAYAWNPQGDLGAGGDYQSEHTRTEHWLHLVACFQHYTGPCEGKTGVQLFVNGQLVAGPPSRGTLYFNEGNWSVKPRGGDAPLRFGTRSATPNSYLTGSLDEIAIYPSVLTPEQIKRHFDLGTGG